MLLSHHRIGSHLLVSVLKDILMDNSRDFYVELQSLIEDTAIDKISLNLSEVRYMDSSGIGSVIRMASSLKPSGRIISVFSLSKALNSVFKLSGLQNILVIHTKEEFIENYPEFKDILG
ncbi:MAG: STAS domain-containing protein [Leptospiraceae bacterium]|nr:STAS domain-containing protein [Leptospiraceae bacterium]